MKIIFHRFISQKIYLSALYIEMKRRKCVDNYLALISLLKDFIITFQKCLNDIILISLKQFHLDNASNFTR